MKARSCLIVTLIVSIGMAGCAVTPSTVVQAPMTAKPSKPVGAPLPSGSIFQASAYRPIFEDRRARLVGDVLTISISENTAAGKTDSSSGGKKPAAPAIRSPILHFRAVPPINMPTAGS